MGLGIPLKLEMTSLYIRCFFSIRPHGFGKSKISQHMRSFCCLIGFESPEVRKVKKTSSWWFQPIWKIFVKLDHFPNFRDENSENDWNHHLDICPTQKKNSFVFLITSTSPTSTNFAKLLEELEDELLRGSSSQVTNLDGIKSAGQTFRSISGSICNWDDKKKTWFPIKKYYFQ